MRIAVTTFALSARRGIGGPGRYQLGLLRGLAKLDTPHSFYLLCNSDNVDLLPRCAAFTNILCGSATERVPTRILWEHVISPFHVRRLGIDVLHSTNFVSPLYVPCCSVVTVHDMTWFLQADLHLGIKRRYFQSLIPWSVHRSQRVVTDSLSARRDIIDILRVPEEKVEATYLGVDVDQFHAVVDESSTASIERKYGVRRKGYILYVGGIHPRKNVPALVKAFGVLKARGSTEKLLIVGSLAFGNEPLLAAIATSSARDDITLAGQAPEGELPALYTNASLVVYPSLYEGFGFPVLEAMACRTPVVTSTASSLPEVAGTAALLADPTSIDDLAEKMGRVLSDSALQERMVACGVEQVRKFSWEQTARKTVGIYEQAHQAWSRPRGTP